MQKTGIKFLLLLLLFFLLTLGFNAFLTISSFKKNNIHNYFSLAETIAKRTKTQIETGLIFGKKLEIFYGLKKLLHKSIKGWNFISNACILNENKQLITSLKKIRKKKIELITDHKIDKNNMYNTYLFPKKKIYALETPILKNKKIEGYLIFYLSNNIDRQINHIIHTQIKIIVIVAYISFCILCFLLYYLMNYKVSEKLKYRVFFAVTFTIILAQTVYGLISMKQYYNKLTLTINKKIQYIHKGIVSDFQYLLSKGVSLNHVGGLRKYLYNILQENKEVGSIVLLKNNKKYMVSVSRLSNNSWINKLNLLRYRESSPLFNENNIEVATLETSGNPDFVWHQIMETCLDNLTVVILCLIFLGELNSIFIPLLLQQLQIKGIQRKKSSNTRLLRLLRTSAFLFFFSYDMPLSFLTLYMGKFNTLPGILNKDIWLSLPVTVEMFFATIATIIGGSLSDKHGWQRPFYIGLILAATGLTIVPTVNSPWFYLMSRSLAGSGFGLLLISLQSSAVQEFPETKAKGIANIFAGVFAGSLCGNVIGAMLAERWSFEAVFSLAGILLIGATIYLFFIFKHLNMLSHPGATHFSKDTSSIKLKAEIKNVLYNPRAIGLITLIAIPSAMALVGIVYYLAPLYLKKLGVSQGSIGRVLMIYGLCIIYIGPWISSFIDKMENKTIVVIIAGCISSFAILPFILYKGGIISVIISIFLIGLASSCGAACFVVYFLDITSKINTSEQKKISIFRTLQRIGQIIGSFIFANMIAYFGFQLGMKYLFFVLIGTTILFFFINTFSEKALKKEQSL